MSTSDKRQAALKTTLIIIIGLGVVIGIGWAIFSGDDEPYVDETSDRTITLPEYDGAVDDEGNVIEEALPE